MDFHEPHDWKIEGRPASWGQRFALLWVVVLGVLLIGVVALLMLKLAIIAAGVAVVVGGVWWIWRQGSELWHRWRAHRRGHVHVQVERREGPGEWI